MKNDIKIKEKKFLQDLKKVSYDNKYNNKKLNKLDLYIKKINKKIEFYKNYINFSNDFLLEYEINKILSKEFSEILKIEYQSMESIEFYKKSLKESKRNVDFEIEYKKLKKHKYLEFLNEKQILYDKYKEKTISKKALKNELINKKIRLKKDLEFKLLEDEKKFYKNKIKVLKNQRKYELKNRYEKINIQISDIKNKIPLDEGNSVCNLIPLLTFFIPGSGQIILKEYLKGILYLIGSIFIYFMAIPYALGYGNYRGEGIKGLINLAQNGKKLDKSLLFMIEGIIAIGLLFIAILIFYYSFKDVINITKNRNNRKRALNTYELKKKIFEEGFPYIVTDISGILLLFIVIVPIVTTIFLSFTNMDPNHQSKFNWVGLDNYKFLIRGEGIAGGPFYQILAWTLIWTFVATSLAIFVGFSLSLIAHNDRIKGKTFFRTIYLLPWAIPAFITIMFFSIMTSNQGIITKFIENLTGHYIEIKNITFYTRMFLIFLQTWLGSSYVFLLSTGVLQSIPNDLYEAADIDGANPYQKLTKIIIPLVLMQTAPLLIGQYTFNFNNFSIIYLFNGGGPFNTIKYGNIAGSSDLLISYIYKLTIQKSYQAIGSAITVFISLGLIFITYIGFKNTKVFKEEN